MNQVWKFELLSGSITVPMGAQLLDCQFQRTQFQRIAICAWMLVDPKESRKTTLSHMIVGTGDEFEPGQMVHWATLQDPAGSVRHVFGERIGRAA